MTSKERIIAMLRNTGEADRIPNGENAFDSVLFEQLTGRHTLAYAGWEELEALWRGERDRIVADYIDALCCMATQQGWDYVRVPLAPPRADYSAYRRTGETEYTDGRGNYYTFNPAVGNIVAPKCWDTEMTTEEFTASFDANPAVTADQLEIVKGVVERIGGDHFIIGRPPCEATFPSFTTVGIEEYLMRMLTDPEFVHETSRLHTQKYLVYAEALLAAGCDAVMETSDYGDTRGLIMGPKHYHEFIEPYLRDVTRRVHALGGYFIKHTDGVLWDALDSFVDMGVDAWHGIQPKHGLTLKAVREKIGDRLCIFGGINADSYCEGTRELVLREFEDAVAWGLDGGLVIAAGNILEPGTRPELYSAVRERLEVIGRLK